jgi:hypothetical protein
MDYHDHAANQDNYNGLNKVLCNWSYIISKLSLSRNKLTKRQYYQLIMFPDGIVPSHFYRHAV